MPTPTARGRPLRYAAPVTTSFYGSTPERQHRTRNLVASLFPGHGLDTIAAATGAPAGSHVTFSDFGTGKLRAIVKHPTYTATRTFQRLPTGELQLHLDRSDSTGPKGQHHNRFHQMINAATSLGIDHLSTVGSADNGDNGAYSNPRLGFNGPLFPSQFATLSPELQGKIDAAGPRDFHTLFAAGGAPEWKQKFRTGGGTGELRFDLTPNSPHRKAFSDYLATKADRSTGATPASPAVGTGNRATGAGGNTPVAPQLGVAPTRPVTQPGPASGVQPSEEADSEAARRDARLRRIRELTQKPPVEAKPKYRRATPTSGDAGLLRFSRSHPTHPLVQGLRLENVLQRLQSDPTLTETAAELAAAALHSGSPATLAALHEELEEFHPELADRWNWDSAVAGITLDHDVELELDALETAFGSRAVALRRLRAAVEANPKSQPELRESLRRLSRRYRY